jgi:hypothetical protein
VWRLFRRQPKGWLTITDYGKLREQEIKRNPELVAQELEQASLWSMRVAERKLNENRHRSKEKKSSG